MGFPFSMEPDKRARWLGLSHEELERKAAWLAEKRELQDIPAQFFRDAGKLVSFSWYYFPFASHAFFQTVLGLEDTLRQLNSNRDMKLKEMLLDVVKRRLVSDSVFSPFRFSQDLWKNYTGEAYADDFELADETESKPKQYPDRPQTHVEVLSLIVPQLRNLYFHGGYQVSPDHLILAFQMRELADALAPAVEKVRLSMWRLPTRSP